MTEQDSAYSDEHLPPPEAPHIADRHIAMAINLAAMDDWVQIYDQLLPNLPPQIDRSEINKAYLYMLLAHTGQPREHRPGVKFFVHPLAVASLTVATFGENTTTDQIVVAMLHDVIEKGKIGGKPVSKEEIEKHFGSVVADGIAALSNSVQGKNKIELPEYCQQIIDADNKHPLLRLPEMKCMADRLLNYFDPVVMPVPEEAAQKRKKKLDHDPDPSGPIMSILLSDNKYAYVRQTILRAAQISRRTIEPHTRFSPKVWARRVLQ